MVRRPLKYGVTTILIINFSNYDTMITQIWFYTILMSNFFKNRRRIYFKIIHNFEGTLYRKRDYDLKLLFIPKDIKISKDYELKTIIYSEWTLNRKGTMVLRTLLISKGQKKGDESKKDSSTQVKKGRREKEFPTTQ